MTACSQRLREKNIRDCQKNNEIILFFWVSIMVFFAFRSCLNEWFVISLLFLDKKLLYLKKEAGGEESTLSGLGVASPPYAYGLFSSLSSFSASTVVRPPLQQGHGCLSLLSVSLFRQDCGLRCHPRPTSQVVTTWDSTAPGMAPSFRCWCSQTIPEILSLDKRGLKAGSGLKAQWRTSYSDVHPDCWRRVLRSA